VAGAHGLISAIDEEMFVGGDMSMGVRLE